MSPAAPIGRRIAALAAALAVIAPVIAPGLIAAADEWVVEPTPEGTNAVANGAADVVKAQKLAKQKMLDDAVLLLEQVAHEYPASEHDCNLALAYLRKGDLTRAQLWSDVAGLRGGARPDWCTSSLPAQLAQALRDEDYVPLTVTTTPADAVIEVAGLTVRDVHLFWLPVATYNVVARAEGYDDEKAPVVVASPGAKLTMTMSPIKGTVDVPVDTHVDGTGELGEVELNEVEPPPKPVLPPPTPRPSWPGWAGIAGGGVFLALGAGFHLAALGTKDDANAVVNDTPMFDSLSSTFSRERAVAIGSYVIGTAALSFGIWWLTHTKKERR
jgi:hypothetical protein